MKNLTPNQLVVLKQSLKPIAKFFGTTQKRLLDEFNEKRTDFKGLVGQEAIIELLKSDLAKEFGKIFKTDEEEIEKPVIKKKKNVRKKVSNISKDFWDDVEIGSYTPFLKIQNGIVYSFDLLSEEGEYRRDTRFERDQWVWDIRLTDISPEKALKEENKEGYPLYVLDKDYTLALGKKAMMRFKELHESNDYDIDSVTMERKGKSFQTDYVFKVD